MNIAKTKNETEYNYNLEEQNIEWTQEEKDIGVTIDSGLKFGKHISEKVNKANSMFAIIRRAFKYLNAETFMSLVRSQLDYASSVWAPYRKKHIDKIEQVQKRATKQIPETKNLNYEERIRKLKLSTIGYRRVRGDMIEIYKIIKGKYDKDVITLVKTAEESEVRHSTRTNNSLQWESLQQRRWKQTLVMCYKIHHQLIVIEPANYYTTGDSRTRGNHRLRQIRAKKDTYQHSFFPRSIREWN
jgi:hypothetical protein